MAVLYGVRSHRADRWRHARRPAADPAAAGVLALLSVVAAVVTVSLLVVM